MTLLHQDDSTAVHLDKQSQVSDQALLTLDQLKAQAVNSIFMDQEQSLTSLRAPGSAAAPCLSDMLMDKCPAAPSKAGAGHGKSSNTLPLPSGAETDSDFPALTKCVKGCSDPVTAAVKLRKATLRDFNMLESKLEKAFAACKESLNMIQDDFDTEDRWQCVCVFFLCWFALCCF